MNFGKRSVQSEIVPRLFRIGLRAFEIMDRSAHKLPGLLVRTSRMHRVPHHLQRLKRHHHLIIFNIISNKHQNFGKWHFARPSAAESSSRIAIISPGVRSLKLADERVAPGREGTRLNSSWEMRRARNAGTRL